MVLDLTPDVVHLGLKPGHPIQRLITGILGEEVDGAYNLLETFLRLPIVRQKVMVEASDEPTTFRQGLIPTNVLLVPKGMGWIVNLYVVLDPSLWPEDGNIEGVVL
ncbi:hypothetical protein D3C86_1508320 [compost metagenome]